MQQQNSPNVFYFMNLQLVWKHILKWVHFVNSESFEIAIFGLSTMNKIISFVVSLKFVYDSAYVNKRPVRAFHVS